MTYSASAPAAGWYPDPSGHAVERYWDGSQWTVQVRPGAAQPQAPAVVAAAPAEGSTATGGAAQPQAPAVATAAPAEESTATGLQAQAAVVSVPAALSPAPAEAAPAVKIDREEQVALSEQQRAFLTEQTTVGKSFMMAFRWVGVLIAKTAIFGDRLAKVVRYVPLIGFILWIYAVVATIALPIAITLTSPLIALILLPAVLLRKRPKVRADIESGAAVRQVGTFVVRRGRSGGGFLISPSASLYLSSEEFASLHKAHPGTEKHFSLDGAMVRSARSGLLLGFYDQQGQELVGAKA